MNAPIKTKPAIAAAFFVAAAAATLSIVAPPMKTALLVPTAHAAQEPRVIEIKAKKFEFSPADVTLKKGEPVILRLTSEDRTHGFLL